jgi:hypothetical protein
MTTFKRARPYEFTETISPGSVKRSRNSYHYLCTSTTRTEHESACPELLQYEDDSKRVQELLSTIPFPFETASRRERGRNYSKQGAAILEQVFLLDPMPSAATKKKLSELLGLSIKQVQIWFQNRYGVFPLVLFRAN